MANVRIFSFIYGAIFLVIGLLGLIPNAWPLMAASLWLSILYVVTGGWMISMAFCQWIFMRHSLQVIGIIYIALVVLGLFFNVIGSGANTWFQFIMLVPAIIVGFSKAEEGV